MTSERLRAADGLRAPQGLGWASGGLLAALIYLVIVGGTGSGELQPTLRVLNAAVAVIVIGIFILRAPGRADQLDRLLLLALVLFAVAGALSQYPRQSFDAVLAATAYVAGLFLAREQMARSSVRHAFIRVCIGLSALFTIGAAALWLPQVLEWWSLADRAVLPPLDFQLSSAPWGHRYDVALLIALLYPAWWMGRPSVMRRGLAICMGLLGMAVIVVTGSRTTWIALVVATAAMGIPVVLRHWRQHPRAHVPAVLGTLLIAAAVIASGAGTPLAERALNPASIGLRLAMWGPLTELWLDHPIAGIGPGSFPWALQLTSYFDIHSWAPRHPDNPLFQVLSEAGVLGVAAMVLIAVAVLPVVFRGRSNATRWAAIVILVTCAGANPTDFAFLIVIGLAWAAYGAPRTQRPTSDPGQGRRRPWHLAGLVVAGGIILIAYSSTLVGAVAYEAARSAVARDDLADADDALRLAMALDPGMALYHRQHGALAYIDGNPKQAVVDLERAVQLNPSDDLAWRTLALAYDADSRQGKGLEALDRAVSVQRADPTNLLLAARAAALEGQPEDAEALLAEIVQTWPTIAAAPGWLELMPGSVTTADILDQAADRWMQASPTPDLVSDQGLWLGVLAGRPDVVEAARARTPIGDELQSTLTSVIACEPEARQVLDHIAPAEKRNPVYWQLRVRTSGLEGEIDHAALRALQIMTGQSYEFTPERTLNPLDENAALSADRWGYRRRPIQWPAIEVMLPSVRVGTTVWLLDPRAAVEAAGLASRFESC
jgi:O-antigen ligase/tetratricopeptide (TPR) repeat protein